MMQRICNRFAPSIDHAYGLRPAHAVEPLLKHVIRARHQVVVLPQAQAVDRLAVHPPVAAQVGDGVTVAGLGTDQAPPLHRALLRLGHGGGVRAGDDLDIVVALGSVLLEDGTHPKFLGDNPRVCQGCPQSGGGGFGFHHVVKLTMSPALGVGFQSVVVDLLLGGVIGGLLDGAYLGADGRIAAHQVECAPSQQRRHRRQVGAIGGATDASRLERDGTATTDRVADAGEMAKTPLSQLAHQFRQGIGCRAQVSVDFRPCFRRWAGDLLRTQAVIQLLVVVQAVEGEALHQVLFLGAQAGTPACFRLAVGIAQPNTDFALGEQGFQRVLVDGLGFALTHPDVVHGHDLEKYLAVALRIIRYRHQQADQTGAHQHQWLASPPLAQRGKRLSVVRHALLVGFCGNAGDGELLFDETQVSHGVLVIPCRRWAPVRIRKADVASSLRILGFQSAHSAGPCASPCPAR